MTTHNIQEQDLRTALELARDTLESLAHDVSACEWLTYSDDSPLAKINAALTAPPRPDHAGGVEPSRAAKAYGALWRDCGPLSDQVKSARALLSYELSSDDKRAGIAWAIQMFGPVAEQEVTPPLAQWRRLPKTCATEQRALSLARMREAFDAPALLLY